MSNPFNDFDDEGESVLEGFLCPICKEDLKSPDRLTAHVENVHSDDQDLLKSFRDIFITAKNRIKRFDENLGIQSSGSNSSGGVSGDNSLKTVFSQAKRINVSTTAYSQCTGADCSHISYFKAIRNPRLERYATETNKLIIRLHKLLTDLPSDPVQRKQHERNIVPWLDGESVKLCPNCVKRFYLARRQHHCRLCGSIMCHDCSNFLDLYEASNIINPSSSPSQPLPNEERTKNEEGLRMCEHCLRLLINRKEMQESRTYRPPITVYYDKIQELRKEIAPDTKMYTKIIDRLYEGDAIYTLADASALRAKIGRIAETIDAYSKAILNLPCPNGSREEALKKAVRLACIKYIKDELLSLDPLPLEAEIKKLQEKRRHETEMKIERERRLALEAIEKYELVGGPVPVSPRQLNKIATGSGVASLDNWSGCQTDTMNTSSDPLVEQINIIKGYIKQAREALRFEEVETLQLNLQELQQEFYNRQRQNDIVKSNLTQ